MAAQGRTRKGCHHMRWALVQHMDGLLSDLHLPVLGGLPSTVGSSSYKPGGQSHGTPGAAPMHSSRLPALRIGRTPPAEGRGAEGRPKPPFPGAPHRWGAGFVAHRKCLHPDFNPGSTEPVIALADFTHLLSPPSPLSVNRPDK